MSEGYSRSEKSLSSLTVKFVEMMKAEKGPLDLNVATKALEVSKKRRIYDITNVLEGVNLIEKVEKNFYIWRGRNSDDEIDNKRLEEKQEESRSLIEQEKQLTDDIIGMRKYLAGLLHSKSQLYLVRNDFRTAYGRTNSAVIAKNVKKLFVDRDEEANPFLLMLSEVHNPVQLQLANTDPKKSTTKSARSLLCHEKLTNDNGISKMPRSEDFKRLKHTGRLTLFQRRLRWKKFLEIDEKEREEIARIVLSRPNQKSILNEDNEDSTDPDFLPITHPVDYEYFNSYSSEPASIHDLFDLDVEPMVFMDEEFVHHYIEEEHLEDDE